jgi:hypothetical protein
MAPQMIAARFLCLDEGADVEVDGKPDAGEVFADVESDNDTLDVE